MALYNFHRVLISMAILFAFGFGLYSLNGHFSAMAGLAMAVGSFVVMAAMIAYLIYFNLKLQRHVTRGEYH